MKRHRTRLKRAVIAGAVAAASLAAVMAGGTAHAVQGVANDLNFTPLTNNALTCAQVGDPVFANDKHGNAVLPATLMEAGEAATPVNAPPTANAVGGDNDMIALSPDGRYLFTPSESSPSGGLTRLTLKGPDAGTKEILAFNPAWSRMDGVKWYRFNGSPGVLLISEEFATGGIWQVDPDAGDFERLDWLGSFAHEGIGLDAAGNLYLGDENNRGAIYKAVPNDVRDLTAGGTLYYLVGTGVDATGWKQVTSPANATTEASNGGAVLFNRPEDFDEANGLVYFAVTEPAIGGVGGAGQTSNVGGVYVLTTAGVPNLAVQSGTGLPATYHALVPMIGEQALGQQGLQYPDNLWFDGRGHLWVLEDIPDAQKTATNQQDEVYVYILTKAGDAIVPNPDTTGPGASHGYKAIDMRTSPGATAACQNEPTGAIFGQDGQTLYINQQHAENPTLTARIG